MRPSASPRHPFKALIAIAAAFAVVHGMGAHAHAREHPATRVEVVDTPPPWATCPPVEDDDTDEVDEPDEPAAERGDGSGASAARVGFDDPGQAPTPHAVARDIPRAGDHQPTP